MTRATVIAAVAAILAASVIVFVSCGGGGSSPAGSGTGQGTFVMKGVAASTQIPPKPSAPPRAKTLSAPLSPGTYTGCDGPDSICCDAGTGCDPASARMKTYKMWLSTSPTCSNAVLVADNGVAGSDTDAVAAGTLFTSSVDPGDYSCIIIKVDDTMDIVPNATAAGLFSACTQTTHSIDLFKTGDMLYDYEAETGVSGQGDEWNQVKQPMYLFITTETNAANVLGGAVSSNQMLPLSAPIHIPASGSATGYMDYGLTDKIEMWNDGVNPAVCWMWPGTAAFVVK